MFTIFTFANNSFALLTRNLECLVDGVADLNNDVQCVSIRSY